MTGKYMFDVFGGLGFLAKAKNHLGLRGCVPDTKFEPKYHVTMLLVHARIRQDVSAGTCVAGMISRPRQHTSCSPTVASANATSQICFNPARMSWILEHACDSWLRDVPNIQIFAAQPRADLHAGNEPCFWLWMWSAENFTVLLADVLELVNVAVCQDIQRLRRLAQVFSRDHTRLSFAVAMVHTMNARRFPGDLRQLAQFALVANLTTAVISSTDLLAYVTLTTQNSQSLKKMMTTSCALILSAEQHEKLLATDIVSHLNMVLFRFAVLCRCVKSNSHLFTAGTKSVASCDGRSAFRQTTGGTWLSYHCHEEGKWFMGPSLPVGLHFPLKRTA